MSAAWAQSSVTLSGTVDLSVRYNKYGSVSMTGVGTDGLPAADCSFAPTRISAAGCAPARGSKRASPRTPARSSRRSFSTAPPTPTSVARLSATSESVATTRPRSGAWRSSTLVLLCRGCGQRCRDVHGAESRRAHKRDPDFCSRRQLRQLYPPRRAGWRLRPGHGAAGEGNDSMKYMGARLGYAVDKLNVGGSYAQDGRGRTTSRSTTSVPPMTSVSPT